MNNRIVDPEITLIPYYPNSDVTLAWYQDPDVCRQVDNIDHPYS
ncbi:MAG TPA: GNAT family N-acetyltransferase, partial [Clostridiales bacterium]|nr:GNAT family N-acetyltransferase [Clostridiales bacterium]